MCVRACVFVCVLPAWFLKLVILCMLSISKQPVHDYFFHRLTVVFLAFDVFFAIFCVALACVIGIALCCCLPCIIAILYAVAGQVRVECFLYKENLYFLHQS